MKFFYDKNTLIISKKLSSDMSNLLEQVLLVNIYLQPVQFSLSIIFNTLSIRILCTRAFRLLPCTHYLLGYAICSVIYTCLICPTQFLRGFNIDWSQSSIGCKIYFYIIFVPPSLARIMLVLASFDRYCSTSSSPRLHSINTVRMARYIIIITTVLFAIYLSPILAVYYYNESIQTCILYPYESVNSYVLSQGFLYYILGPFVMIVFSLSTVYNIRQYFAQAGYERRGRRMEGQIARMLILQIAVHLILGVPFSVIYMMNALDPSTRTPNIIAMRYIFVIWQQFDYFVSFFLYVLSGRIYRQELIRLLKCIRCSNTQIHPDLPLANRAVPLAFI